MGKRHILGLEVLGMGAIGGPLAFVAFWIPKGTVPSSIPSCQLILPQTLFPSFCEPVDFCPWGHTSLVPLFLSTIAQGLCWVFLSPLFPLTLGDLLSLHLSLVLKSAQFPTQSLTSFLSPLKVFIFFNKNTHGAGRLGSSVS